MGRNSREQCQHRRELRLCECNEFQPDCSVWQSQTNANTNAKLCWRSRKTSYTYSKSNTDASSITNANANTHANCDTYTHTAYTCSNTKSNTSTHANTKTVWIRSGIRYCRAACRSIFSVEKEGMKNFKYCYVLSGIGRKK